MGDDSKLKKSLFKVYKFKLIKLIDKTTWLSRENTRFEQFLFECLVLALKNTPRCTCSICLFISFTDLTIDSNQGWIGATFFQPPIIGNKEVFLSLEAISEVLLIWGNQYENMK